MGTPSHPGHLDRVAATLPSQAPVGAAQEAPDIGQWEGQDVPLVRPSSCIVKGGIRAPEDTYLPTCPWSVRALGMSESGRRPWLEPLPMMLGQNFGKLLCMEVFKALSDFSTFVQHSTKKLSCIFSPIL